MNERALFLDATGSLSRSLGSLFQENGWQVDNVSSQDEALELLVGRHPYLSLFIHFPEGRPEDIETLSQLKATLRYPADIYVFGPEQVPFAVRVMQSGARHYWTAPLDATTVFENIRNGHLASRAIPGPKREETLLQIIKEIALTMELDGLANVLIDSALELAKGDAGMILLWDDKTAQLILKAIRGLSGLEQSSHYFGLPAEKCHEIFLSRKPVFLHEFDPPIYSSRREQVDAVIAAPIWWKGEPLALLAIFKFHSDQKSFSSDDFQLISRLATEISGAVHNAIIHYKTKELTIKDDLTEAYNRRYFENYLEEEFFRANRYNSNLSLIFFDVDNLKDINVKFGHLSGSKTLQQIAHRMILTVRGIDKVVRYGGDEFCILLPETDTQGAFQVAERIRTTISDAPFHINESVSVYLTGSIGIASFPTHATSKEELIRQADRAMFSIKNKSKNAIGIAEAVSSA